MIPPPRSEDAYAVAVVCLGNICRSPIAEVVLRARLDDVGLRDVAVDSAGTGGWHVGEPMDPRAAATLLAAGYDPSRHRAQQWVPAWRDRFDLVLAMDAQNLSDLGGRGERTMLFREHDPAGVGDVPDPYYGSDDGFGEVLAMVERTADALVAELAATLAGTPDERAVRPQ
ncbi:low molecular weight phosphotyrosine protein phosphatase [Nocardioides sp. BP30]|uniref:low molecular weight protein-tyrosine-phosphatase n=1 Tax=Nocardioides sp. BP30 TaxID=3036374 RepID=UPI00246983CD|nr:low molecular weight protein-tyrosine-phosphatase [Nocardioides sp. BP30]WGL52343.1 low molecular weight phosphotyrosine protein phosphatase [Nocardioides sp. BP30]